MDIDKRAELFNLGQLYTKSMLIASMENRAPRDPVFHDFSINKDGHALYFLGDNYAHDVEIFCSDLRLEDSVKDKDGKIWKVVSLEWMEDPWDMYFANLELT